MNWNAISFDWNRVRTFLVAAEEGSLSAAARALGTTQPTVSRQVGALEQELGVTLFERGHRSSRLTAAGIELLDHVRSMAASAAQVSLAASGQAQEVRGRVTVSATELVATVHLPPMIARLREVAPAIEIEIVASNQLSDLGRREADIAIRHARPEHADLVARRVATTTGHVFAAATYLDRVGRPETVDDLGHLDFVGFGHPDRMIEGLHARGLPIRREQVKVHTSSSTALLALVEQGLGVSVLTRSIAEARGTLEVVLPELPAIDIPVWLVTHRELRTSRRIRAVWDLLAEELATV